jgi:Rod binding domain-containing protein
MITPLLKTGSPNTPSSSAAETQLDAAPAIKAKLAAKAVDPKIAHVAQQFEEVFVRQLLSSAKMGGDDKEGGGGYGAMTIDALATGVSKGGGLGIAKSIEMALSHSQGPAASVSAAHETPEKSE